MPEQAILEGIREVADREPDEQISQQHFSMVSVSDPVLLEFPPWLPLMIDY